MRADCVAEFRAAADRVQPIHVRHLSALGVTEEALCQLREYLPPFGVVDAEPDADGFYVPGAGPTHIVQPVIAEGIIYDIVAWRSMKPDSWRLRTGLGWVLGEDAVMSHGAWDDGEPLTLHSTPLEWLRAGGVGACVVDWSAPEIRNFIDRPAIIVPDRQLGETLLKILRRPIRLPDIIVQERSRNVA